MFLSKQVNKDQIIHLFSWKFYLFRRVLKLSIISWYWCTELPYPVKTVTITSCTFLKWGKLFEENVELSLHWQSFILDLRKISLKCWKWERDSLVMIRVGGQEQAVETLMAEVSFGMWVGTSAWPGVCALLLQTIRSWQHIWHHGRATALVSPDGICSLHH